MEHNSIIDNLIIDDEAKKVLRTVERIANSDNARVRRSIPSLLVVSDSGCGVTSYGKVYGKILEHSPVLQMRGVETFVELVLPKDNKLDERLFFSSPQRAASIRNRFYGTLLISFSEYCGQDLIKGESFQRLLEYIELNKANIQFIFHILSDFAARRQLVSKLNEYINIIEVCLEKPDVDKAFNYVLAELDKLGLVLKDGCENNFKDRVLSKVIHGNTYRGYKTLNNVVERMNYEVVLGCSNNYRVIGNEIIDKLAQNYKEEVYIQGNKIGFFI